MNATSPIIKGKLSDLEIQQVQKTSDKVRRINESLNLAVRNHAVPVTSSLPQRRLLKSFNTGS